MPAASLKKMMTLFGSFGKWNEEKVTQVEANDLIWIEENMKKSTLEDGKHVKILTWK